MSSTHYLPFNAREVPLEGSNLIEASAGTGKTYSIAIMVLRLVVEVHLPPKEILMVTFTRAAVAELAERVRLFLRMAYKCSRGEKCDDAVIAEIVQIAQEKTGAEVEDTLRRAVLLLDELQVMTIHSFCQNTLSEFAFETAQAFAPDMIPTLKPIVKDYFHKFWRRNINTLPPALLRKLDVEVLRETLTKTIDSHLDGRLYYGFEEEKAYALTPEEAQDWLRKIKENEDVQPLIDEAYDALQKAYKEAKGEGRKITHLDAASRAYKHPKSAFLKTAADDRKFLEKYFPEVLPLIDRMLEAAEKSLATFEELQQHLRYWAISEILKSIAAHKKRANVITYSDMITHLHAALTKPGKEELVQAMRAKYKAAFIDEFQDTDRRQYELFDAAFGEETILFLIGDPKQSIYGFRSADVNTYFMARSRVARVYGMNRNFRSTAQMIETMNVFFKPQPDFNTFAFAEGEEGFQYIPVESGVKEKKQGLFLNGESQPCMGVFEEKDKNNVEEKAAMQIAALLRMGYTLTEDGVERPLRPSDVGVLVRKGKNGQSIRDRLCKMGIPAVYRDEVRVLDTPQAKELVWILHALLEPSAATINRALLNTLLPFTNEILLRLNDEEVVAHFDKYRRLWARDGLLPALSEMARDFDLRTFLLQREGGHRVYANYLQLAELLHATQSRRKWSENETLSWLQRTISDTERTENGAFQQRMERDDEAVEILTIHKSKGLEYNVVIAADFNFPTSLGKDHYPTLSYRAPDGQYFFLEQKRFTQEQKGLYTAQEEQEARRLLYVAVTRAVYGCYLFSSVYSQSMGETERKLLSALKTLQHPQIVFGAPLPVPPPPEEKEKARREEYEVLPGIAGFALPDDKWGRLSYSGLGGWNAHFRLRRAAPQTDDYATFIFETLARNSKTGEMLHYLLERALPDQPTNWNWAISQTLTRFSPAKKEAYTPLLKTLMTHISGAQISFPQNASFSLSQVKHEQRMAELEFDFPVSPFRLEELCEVAKAAGISVSLRNKDGEASGVMNGKMDLLFEHGGKFYVLDWKSNYLGDVPDEYTGQTLTDAMTNANYHLQYLIYTVAAKKYLERRVPGFDYERDFGGAIYLFVRGAREGKESGVFTAKPTAALVRSLEKLFTPESVLL